MPQPILPVFQTSLPVSQKPLPEFQMVSNFQSAQPVFQPPLPAYQAVPSFQPAQPVLQSAQAVLPPAQPVLQHTLPLPGPALPISQPAPPTRLPTGTESDLAIKLAAAQTVRVDESEIRLACVLGDRGGNLIIAPDHSSVDFFPVDQHHTPGASLVLQTEKLLDPTISVKGSIPMELRVHVQSDSNTEKTYRFMFAPTEEGLKAANNMRAKIVTARMVITLRTHKTLQSTEEEEAMVKPFQCEKCQTRYRNTNGLQYHQTKSSAACNSNYVPPPPKQLKARKVVKIVEQTPDSEESPRLIQAQVVHESPVHTTPTADPLAINDVEYVSEETPEYTPVETPAESPADSYLYQDDMEQDDDDEDDDLDVDMNSEASEDVEDLVDEPTDELSDDGSTRKQKALEPRRKRLRNIIPGRKTDRLYKALNKEKPIIKQLCDKLAVAAEAKKPGDAMNLDDPSIGPQTTAGDEIAKELWRSHPKGDLTEALLEDMMMAFIRSYGNIFPDGRSLWAACTGVWLKMHPTPGVLPMSRHCAKALDNLLDDKKLERKEYKIWDTRRKRTTRHFVFVVGGEIDAAKLDYMKDKVQDWIPGFYCPSNFAPPSFIHEKFQQMASRVVAARGLVQFGTAETQPSEAASPDTDMNNADSPGGQDSNAELEGDEIGDVEVASSKKPRSEKHNEKIAAGMSRTWANIKSGGENLFSRYKESSVPSTRSSTHQDVKYQYWNHSPAVLQNPVTGAWDKSAKPRAKYERRHRLPGPITFMQDTSSGAWSVQPVGHGVTPVHARPSRRADGNPHQQDYLKRIGNGPRPVSYPTKNQQYFPALPSKRLLQQSSGGDASEETNTPNKPKRRKRIKGIFLETASPVENSPAQSLVTPLVDLQVNANNSDERISRATGRPMRTYVRRTLPDPVVEALDVGVDDMDPDYDLDEDGSRPSTPEDDALSETSILGDDGLFRKRRRRAQNGSKPKKRRQQKRPITYEESGKYGHRRRMTNLPIDFITVLDSIEQAKELEGVQVAPQLRDSRQRKRMDDQVTPRIEARMLVAVVVISTLCGGLEMMTDWVLIGSQFPKFSINFLRRFWGQQTARKKDTIESLRDKFQQAFPRAYANGEVDPIDFDNLVGYNWEKCIDWAMKNMDTQSQKKTFILPRTKEEFFKTHSCDILDRDNPSWREFFFSPTSATYKRIVFAAADPYSIRIPYQEMKDSYEVDQQMLIKSYIRAMALTPTDEWSHDVAKARMHEVGGEQAIKEALQEMCDAKIMINRLKAHQTPSRTFEVTDAFSAPLRKHVKTTQFIEAAAFKEWLDIEFRQGKEYVRYDYFADDGSVMAISSMQATGRLKLVPVGVPMQKFGLTEPGTYETRTIPRERLRFEINIYPTEIYLYDEDITTLQAGGLSPPPRGITRGEIPVWYSITDDILDEVWGRILSSVGQTVAFRPGTNLEWLVKTHKPTMEEWEIRLLMWWGEACGFFERIEEIRTATGWTVGEWWWLITGRSCVPEVFPRAGKVLGGNL